MPFFQDIKDQFIKRDTHFYEERLYPFQDEILNNVFSKNTKFYLTGGTALNRFILENCRFSDDLDFFMNLGQSKDDLDFFHRAKEDVLSRLGYKVEPEKNFTPFSDYGFLSDSNYVYYVYKNDIRLKVQFVLDSRERLFSSFAGHDKFKIDNINNILTNKIAAIANRKNFKDIVDLVNITSKISPSWSALSRQATLEKKVVGLTEAKLYLLFKEAFEYYASQDLARLSKQVIFTGDIAIDSIKTKDTLDQLEGKILNSFSDSTKIANEANSTNQTNSGLKL